MWKLNGFDTLVYDPTMTSADVFVIEGEIGAGKTEMALALAAMLNGRGLKVGLILEPVEQWVAAGILQQFYDDPKRFAYSFQTFVYATRVMAIVDGVAATPDADVFILERSPATDHIFAALQQMSSVELKMYNTWCDAYDRMLPLDLSRATVLYLKTDINRCMARVASRQRSGETASDSKTGVSIEYQQTLRRAHEAFFERKHLDEFPDMPRSPFARVIIVDSNLANGNFRDPGPERDRIVSTVAKMMLEVLY